jgi:hypothetical protein
MSVEYTIAAIPTLYRGRMYRSRLEARWAAFFDRLGWIYEYEPFDLGKWSPDFMISEPFDALIEIKPITAADPALCERVQDAAPQRGVFVLGTAPVIVGRYVTLGWWAASYVPVTVVWARDPDRPAIFADLLSFVSDLSHWVTATKRSGPAEKPPQIWGYRDHTMALWADACNAVQWEPRT